jgi:NAD-dependent deacetylase
MITKKKFVVLSGAGMSAESGISTFRGAGGLWEKYNVTELASPEAWARSPELVLRFYNERRKKVIESEPNQGHYGLVDLEKYFQVHIITQNVDDLHERAGSSNILHLHGEIRKAKSTGDPNLIYQLDGWELKLGDTCEKGYQLRPHIVWFGESVDAIEPAIDMISGADIVAVIGTSLMVYPAAGLIDYAPSHAKLFLIDPGKANTYRQIEHIKENASKGVAILKERLVNK